MTRNRANRKQTKRAWMKRKTAAVLSIVMAVSMAGCGMSSDTSKNDESAARVGDVKNTNSDNEVILFFPGSFIPDSTEGKDSADGQALAVVQEKLPDLTFTYRNFTTDSSKELSYDDACVERIESGMDDDLYLLNSDVIVNMGRKGLLADLSDIDGADQLIPALKAACTVDGELVSFPREYVAYGLIVNNDILKEHGLGIPETDEEFLACCEKLKADGMDLPMAANRWWLECFVLTQGFYEFYQSDDIDQLIADLNAGTTSISTYMRPGFEFLKTCMDKGYIDAKQADSYEAFMERDAYLAGESAFMISFTGAVTGEGRKLYDHDFDLQVTGFPTKDGQIALASVTGISIPENDAHMDTAKRALEAYVSAEAAKVFCEKNGSFSARKDVSVEVEKKPELVNFMDDINEGRLISASNPAINMEMWGNTCTVVQHLLEGASVDACMDELDQMQKDANDGMK